MRATCGKSRYWGWNFKNRQASSHIRTGWESFVDVGAALAQIRGQRLYRQHHKTFEAYCRQKWAYGRQYAYRLIGAAEAVGHLSPIGDIQKPTHESQVRSLIGLAPEEVRGFGVDWWRIRTGQTTPDKLGLVMAD
ncbi:MAG: hypothetical protein ACYDH9_14180 [Limisphaerales bacterium]